MRCTPAPPLAAKRPPGGYRSNCRTNGDDRRTATSPNKAGYGFGAWRAPPRNFHRVTPHAEARVAPQRKFVTRRTLSEIRQSTGMRSVERMEECSEEDPCARWDDCGWMDWVGSGGARVHVHCVHPERDRDWSWTICGESLQPTVSALSDRNSARCVFRPIRPPVPVQSGHLFRRIPAACGREGEGGEERH
jgi:hypothetical protein